MRRMCGVSLVADLALLSRLLFMKRKIGSEMQLCVDMPPSASNSAPSAHNDGHILRFPNSPDCSIYNFDWMKENAEVQRVNYSLQKHHRELLHQQIDPKLIDSLELAQNPSLNYRRAFEAVCADQQQRFHLPKIAHSSSHQALARAYRPQFTDFEEERGRKFDELINRNMDRGHSFFRAQDDYQRRKQAEKSLASNTLKQQLVINREMRTISKQKENQEAELLRATRQRQAELDNQRQAQRRQQQLTLGAEVQQQMQEEQARRGRKSNFELAHLARHNPITNPIEYHIDNPYILKTYQDNLH